VNDERVSLPIALCGGACIFAVLTVAPHTPPPRPEQAKPEQARVLPLDPLTEHEKHEAEQVALAAPRVQELLGKGRRKTVSVDLTGINPSQEGIQPAAAGRSISMGRFAVVVLFRYEGEAGVRAVVDLARGTVTEAARLSSEQIPMTVDDLAEAWQPPRRDEEVHRALGPEVQPYALARTPPQPA